MTSPHAVAAAELYDLPEGENPVLAGWTLRPGVALAETSRFVDDVWRLEPAVLQKHIRSLTLTFTLIPERYRYHAKQLFFAMLTGPLPAGEKRQTPVGIRGASSEVRRFLRWLDERTPQPGRQPRPALAELTAQDLTDYSKYLLGSVANFGSRENSRRAVRLFWRYRQGLSDPLTIDPRHAEDWPRHRRPVENTTPRIPEPILHPLLTWALRFIDEFAVDILAAEECWRDVRSRFTRENLGRNNDFLDDVQSYLDAHIRQDRPLPGYRGKPNQRFIAVEAGAGATGLKSNPLLRKRMADAVARVGVTEYTWLEMPIRATLDRKPWISGVALQHPLQSLGKLQRMLQASSYIAISFLSGMRDSEIKHLRRGCVQVQRDSDGRPYRWKLTSLAFKGESNPAGTTATWVIGHPAARAIEILEKLQPPEQQLLVADLPHGGVGSAGASERAQSSRGTNVLLADFTKWINDYCAEHGRTDGVPLVNDRPWVATTRQFRRTLAWFIARRPGGSIAGAIQYRHLSVHMFEGYAGTSDSGFRAEVESEQALARGEFLLAMTDGHEHADLAGPAAGEAQRQLETFAEQARFAGTVITDAQRLTRLMRRADPAIYPGTFATCVFNPDKALCHQDRDSRGTLHPTLGTCRPLDCANVALTPDNLALLRTELGQIDDELAGRPSLPPLLQHRLRSRSGQIGRFLDRHTSETT